MTDLRTGETVQFTPKENEQFPTGESTRMAVVENITDDEIVIRQLDDGFTRRITEDQVLDEFNEENP